MTPLSQAPPPPPHPALQFTTDPRSDAACRKYIYVLATRAGGDGGPTPDCVEVYLQGSGQRIFKMTFHPALRFRQLRLLGPETARALLLLTGESLQCPPDPAASLSCTIPTPEPAASGGPVIPTPEPAEFGVTKGTHPRASCISTACYT